jgi:hypothetical protein
MTEEVLIKVEVEGEGSDFQKLGQLKNSLADITDQKKKLAEEFKAGKVPVKEYYTELAKLEVNQKKVGAEYNKLQRSVTGLKSPFENLSQAVKDQAKQVSIAGVSYTTFLNPVTATTAALGALYKLYASSTQGAKDLEFATNTLSAATNILGNEFASLIGTTGKEDGGFFSNLARGAIAYFDPVLAAVSYSVAALKEDLEDLGRELLSVQGDNNERLAENSELLQQVQDSQVKYLDKISLTNQAILNLRKNEEELLRVKSAELKDVEQLLAADTENEDLQTAVLQKTKEISRVKSDTERKVNNILKLESNLKDAEDKRLQTLRETNSELERGARIATLERSLKGESKNPLENLEVQSIKLKSDATTEFSKTQEHLGEVIDANKEKQKTADAAFTKSNEAKAQLLQRIMSDVSSSFQIQLTSIEDFGKSILKGFLTSALKQFKSYIQFKIIGESLASADSIATFGASGLVKAGILSGLVEAAFAAAEGVIGGFAQGGKVMGGTPIRRSNGDDTLITAKRGEAVLTERQQAALGGPMALRLAGVPGFNTGGRVGGSLSNSLFNSGLNQNLLASIKRQRVAVVIEDVERLIDQRLQILQRAQL